jgi:hypothetical protein
MGAIYLYDWYSRYALSHLYEGIICGIEKSIISISIGIWGEAQARCKITTPTPIMPNQSSSIMPGQTRCDNGHKGP